MRNPERRFVAILVGIGATGLATLSKLTAILGTPGWLVASLVGRIASSLAVFWFTFFAANFILWASGAYLYLVWRERS